MKKKLVVPKFKNESEEAKFWANLDLTEHFDPSDFKRGVVFPSLKRTKKLISIRLPEQLLLQVKHQADKLSVPYTRVMKQPIPKGLQLHCFKKVNVTSAYPDQQLT